MMFPFNGLDDAEARRRLAQIARPVVTNITNRRRSDACLNFCGIPICYPGVRFYELIYYGVRELAPENHLRGKMALSTQALILIEQRVANEANRLAAANVLWFFLGTLGAHRFTSAEPAAEWRI
ncbi:hypothetical protein PY650_04670 [Rhizobium calliandrae]|uniref:Uncharacterized protein n=1 Tax=Rhizobium calliandrae TaxID=1312182 RepID=A0ABT7KC62_9HYPH|nr:hypothetical protein [Rhizobium calliandrae]MDL2404963.1 hypothetical protein [Rhizobium calliandrae]